LSADDRLIDTNQPARKGSGIFIRSQQVRDLVPPGWDVYQVGDCVAPLGIAEALQAARLLVTQLSH